MELLEELRRCLRLDHISDLRGAKLGIGQLRTVARLPIEEYSAAEWSEAVRYLAGCVPAPAERDKAAIMGLLLQKTEGGDAAWRPLP